MKRFFSIALTILIILNTCGYYLLLVGFRAHNGMVQTSRIASGEYSGSETIIITIPLAIPYAANDKQYKETSGKLVHDKQTYRLVKRRMMNDTLFIVCVKDGVDTKLSGQITTITEAFAETSQKQEKGSFRLQLLKDYLPQKLIINHETAGWARQILSFEPTENYLFNRRAKIFHPPA